ncbi:virulence RhuM family protein, partial [Halothiobacillus sp.]|uniref:virulence RhuM family protein n=1 Tax=Halothiobacillus sp. TaxID=1891311 RepID=UPI002AD23047
MNDGLGEIVLYEAPDGEIHLEVRLERDTVWLSQEQMAALFDVQKAAISKHLKNIFASSELERAATVSKMETVQQEGARRVSRQIEHFNLDAVISVGYRVNSARATRFRQWATGVLREHLTQGYTLNRQRFEQNARELEAALALVRKAAQSPELRGDEGRGLVDVAVHSCAVTPGWMAPRKPLDSSLLEKSGVSKDRQLDSRLRGNDALFELRAFLGAVRWSLARGSGEG